MIMAEAGGIPIVTGSSMASAPGGPIPGRTPIRVPIKTPMKQKNKFVGVIATWKPAHRLAMESILEFPHSNSK
jgi:hypothetical protein